MIKIKSNNLIGIIIIFIILMILIKIMPFYNYPFDKIIQNIPQIIISSNRSLSKSEGFISIDGEAKQNIKINKGLTYIDFDIQKSQKISFSTNKFYTDISVFIITPDNIIKIYPQSAIYIEYSLYNITLIAGTIEYENINKDHELTFKGENKPNKLKQNDTLLLNIIKDQKEKQKDNIIKLYGGKIILNRTFDYIIHNIILILYKIDPKRYKDNLQNYNNFKTYINNTNSDLGIILDFQKYEKNNINKDILKQLNKGLLKTINSF